VIDYDNKKSGTQSFPAVIDDKGWISISIPSRELKPRVVVPRTKKAPVATPAANSTATAANAAAATDLDDVD